MKYRIASIAFGLIILLSITACKNDDSSSVKDNTSYSSHSSEPIKTSKEAVSSIESDTVFYADIELTESVKTVTTANETTMSQTISTSANKIILESENITQDTTIENEQPEEIKNDDSNNSKEKIVASTSANGTIIGTNENGEVVLPEVR